MEKAKPYVGITGPVTNKEVENIIKEFSDASYTMNSEHIPMLGFLISYKTLNGKYTQNRRYPNFDDLHSLLIQTDNRVLTMVHYNSRETDSLADQVFQIFDEIYYAGLCKALQLNIVWPDVNQVKIIKDRFKEMKIVFQANHKAMNNKTPNEIVDGIEEYKDHISYVLIDPSGGRGKEFDLDHSLSVYNELKSRLPDLTIGFAGGFNGDNVEEKAKKIIESTGDSDFCIDAEGGLRDKVTDAYGDDLLNIEKVRKYLHEASCVLK